MNKAVSDMTEGDFLHLVKEMRHWQARYFAIRNRFDPEKQAAYRESRLREKRVDAYIALHTEVEEGLFA